MKKLAVFLFVSVAIFCAVPAFAGTDVICSYRDYAVVSLGPGDPGRLLEERYGVVEGTSDNGRLDYLRRCFDYNGSVKLLGASEPNAFALSDGRVYFTKGIMKYNNSALADVMGHELTHIYKKHGQKRVGRSLDGALFGAVFMKLIGGNVGTGTLAGFELDSAHNSRKDEYEADKLGHQLATRAMVNDASYDPYAFVRMLEDFGRLRPGSTDIISKNLASHPPAQNRAQRLTAQNRELQQAPLKTAGAVGPMLVVVEDRLSGGQSGFYIFTTRRIWPSYDDPTAKMYPAVVEHLVKQGFDVVDEVALGGFLAGYDGGYELNDLLTVAEKTGATHLLVVALVEDKTVSTGSVEVRSGRFGRRTVEGEFAQRTIKVTARLTEVKSWLAVWSTSKLASENALFGSYSDFGFLNGVRVEYGVARPKAVDGAAKKIAEALRADIRPPGQPLGFQVGVKPPGDSRAADPGSIGEPPVIAPNAVEEEYELPVGNHNAAKVGARGVLFEDLDDDGYLGNSDPAVAVTEVVRVENGKVYFKVVKTLPGFDFLDKKRKWMVAL